MGAFNEALKEDMKELEAEFGLAEARTPAEDDDLSKLNVQDAVRAVRDPNNPYNWLLVQAKVNAKVGTSAAQAINVTKLKKVDVQDRSAPSPFGEFKLRKTPHPSVMADISQASSSTLKHVDTNDKSAPVIESSVTVGKSKHGDVMAAIKSVHS